MGQYFKAINIDKKEVVCPWCIGGGAKLWEWAANPTGAIWTILLRRSDGSGGGDYYGYRTQEIVLDDKNPSGSLLAAMKAGAAMEGQPVPHDPTSVVGRWAGDRVMLIGDYDSSKLWDTADGYRNISREVVEAWNPFLDLREMQLTFRPDCSCH